MLLPRTPGPRPDGSRDAAADGESADDPLRDRTGESGAAPRWDIRLVPAAALGWLTAWAAPLLPAGVLLVIAVLALVGASWLLRRRAARSRNARPGRGAALALALAGLALVAGTAAAHIQSQDGSPLRELAARGLDVRIRVEVSEPIRVLAPGAAGARVLVRARALAVSYADPIAEAATRSWILGGKVLIFAPAQGWAELTPATTVSATVSLAVAAPEDLLIGIAFARGPPEQRAPPTGVLDRAAAGIRSGLRDRAEQTLGPDEAGLLRGIVLGDTAGMDAVLVEDFRLSGLSHLTAVSGTNCAIVIGAVLWPLRRSRLRGVTRSMFAAVALGGFVLLVGPQPSVLRAAAMGAITLLALATGRARQAIPALAGAVLLLLALDPALARDLGFALSVSATAGIVILAGTWAARLRARGWPAAVGGGYGCLRRSQHLHRTPARAHRRSREPDLAAGQSVGGAGRRHGHRSRSGRSSDRAPLTVAG